MSTRPARAILRFLCDRSGATAIEYSMIAVAVAVVIVAGVAVLGGGITTLFATVAAAFGG